MNIRIQKDSTIKLEVTRLGVVSVEVEDGGEWNQMFSAWIKVGELVLRFSAKTSMSRPRVGNENKTLPWPATFF